METEQEPKRTERLLAPDGGINTWINCPYRDDDIWPYDRVINGVDYKSRLCPFNCPVSPRNADYSHCKHPDNTGRKITSTRGCLIGGFESTRVLSLFCEAAVLDHKCPMKFVR